MSLIFNRVLLIICFIFACFFIKENFSFNKKYMEDFSKISFIEKSRNAIREHFSKYNDCNNKRGEILNAMFLGEMKNVDENQNIAFRKSGLCHLLSASGIHCVLLAIILEKLLNLIIKIPIFKKYRIPITLIPILNIASSSIFLFIANFSLPTLRSVLFIQYISFEKIFGLKAEELRGLIISIGITMVLRPNEIFSASFLLTTTSLIGLCVANNFNTSKDFELKNEIDKGLTVGLFTTLPTAYFFGDIPVYASISNLFAIPYFEIILLPIALLSFILPDLIVKLAIDVFIESAFLFEKLPFSTFRMNFIILAFLTVFLIAILFSKKLRIYAIAGFILLSCYYSIKYFYLDKNLSRKINENLKITFLDVANGDSTLLQFKNNNGENENILIDMGPKIFPFKSNLYNKIIHEGIKTIDYAIFTHGDFDHTGGLLTMQNNIKIKNIVIDKGEGIKVKKYAKNFKETKFISPSEFHHKFIKLIELPQTKIINSTNSHNKGNSFMTIALINFYNNKILITGDIDKEDENYLLRNIPNTLAADILKVPHHGSKSSSSEFFLKAIHPKISVISVGIKNKYNHPNIEVEERLRKYSKKLLETRFLGDIEFEFKSP